MNYWAGGREERGRRDKGGRERVYGQMAAVSSPQPGPAANRPEIDRTIMELEKSRMCIARGR